MGRFGILAMLAAAAFGQSQQPPWSEQPPLPQRPAYPQQPPPQFGPPGQPGPGGPYQQGGQQDEAGFARDHGVARISFMTGNVSVRRGDSGEMVAAIINAPLTVGDRVVTAEGARAEVQLDFANVLRIGPSTEIRLSELQQGRYQIQISTGTSSFRVLRDSDAQVEISTPSVAVHPLRKGIYRVSVTADGTTEITVRGGGDSEVVSPGGAEPLHAGHTMLARGSANDPEFQTVPLINGDDFDSWAASRDKMMEGARSPQNVNRGAFGTEDLDQYGQWQSDPGNPSYGNVWVPQQGPGWAPYQCGRWVWMDFYGWTWVGCEPWAWAPYHYGNWYYGGLGWAWYPGAIAAPLFFRPALVGFFGFGAPGVGVGFGFGFGFGSLGWVPLAPGERFVPWYGAGFYGHAMAPFIARGNLTGFYRNASVTTGVTAMRAGEFGRAGVSASTMVRPSAMEMAHVGSVRGQVPASPSRESTQFSNRAASSAGMPRSSDTARFAGRNVGSQNRVSFDQQQRSFNSAAQRGFGGGGANPGYRGGSTGSNGGSNAGSNDGYRRFDPSTRPGGAGAANRPPAASPGGAGRPGYGNPPSLNRNSQPQNSPRQASPQQPVRVNPSIVQNRGNSTAPRGTSSGGSRGGSRGGGGRH
jgi:hypothetical protein